MRKADDKATALKKAKKLLRLKYLNKGKGTSGVQFFYQKLRF